MKSKLLFKIFGAGFVVLMLAAGLGYFSVNGLKRDARDIVEDTLPGLSLSGAANAYLADSSRTLLLIIAENPARRAELRSEIESLSQRTTGFLDQYEQLIRTDEDRKHFETLVNERAAYLKIRNQIIDLGMNAKKEQALAMFDEVMIPAHKRVKAAGDALFDYNRQQGDIRGKRIMAVCAVTQIAVAIVSVIIFLVGFFIGLFK